MFIKSIVLDGFKSYGQRTEISGFDNQFNAITGLNGSGKSNILDSICFLLGISNLSHVRAGSLQDLIYKSGQAGVNKATVSITFDNRNPAQCPPGFESYQEITITRQIVMGGKNKYMINGTNVPNKKVQDLFCSIQLNVNNPHFLIMQGRITKVLNMRPAEILAMVEEAAGTRMYEVKKQACQKTIDKKDAKLQELVNIAREEISPKLEKLREERSQYLEYQRVERELEHMNGLFHVWQYFEAQKILNNAAAAFAQGNSKIEELETVIQTNIDKAKQLDVEIEEITNNSKTEKSNNLKTKEAELKQKEHHEAKVTAIIKSIQENIVSEEKKIAQFEKNIVGDTNALNAKQKEHDNVQAMFETLKENDKNDSKALEIAIKKFEALNAGMEVNEDGETETLQEQLINAKQEASAADTESKQAQMQLTFCQQQYKQKNSELANMSDVQKDGFELQKHEKDVKKLEGQLNSLNFSQEHFDQLLAKQRALNTELRGMKEQVDRFQAERPHAQCVYQDPEPNFNRSKVHGTVGRLITAKDSTACTALETAAGRRLYDVIVDTDVTSKKLLERGQLKQRTTFIPLNRIQAHRMDDRVVRLAQDMVGKENCRPALDLLSYDKKLQPAMEFIFGNVFICKDLNVAKKVTFDDRIQRRCVTLEGDVTDPAGTLSGGARQRGGSVLLQLQEIKKIEDTLAVKKTEYAQLEAELRRLGSIHDTYYDLKQKLDMQQHEILMIKKRLQSSVFHRQKEEVEQLKTQIAELSEKVKTCQANAEKSNKKAKDLVIKMKDSAGYKEKQLKAAEIELKTAKKKSEKSKNEWQQREHEYETLKLEISELQKGIEHTKEQIILSKEAIGILKEKQQQQMEESKEILEEVQELRIEVKNMKAEISEKNRDIQAKTHKKEKLLAENNEIKLEIQKHSHDIKKLQEDLRCAEARENELSKRLKEGNTYIQKAKELSTKEGQDLERKIRVAQEKKNKLSRTVNAKAQSMFEHEEKQFAELRKKQRIVENDKKKMLTIIENLDQKKKHSLKLAYEQVSKDFGSIFGTLLPGANARLAAPFGQTILNGLEVKVSLGGVWKESLTELSGGQRSLAALSLILAMLLFKPAPLYILDEVDAALDLSHTQNIGNMLKTHFQKSQFIIVSLKDGMFNNANVLYRTKFVDGVSTVNRTVNKR